jgi:tryptophan halogenase
MTADAPQPVRVVVLGGGTAGWMTAAGIAKLLPGLASVQLVESEEIGIVGVGEATLPHIRGFVEKLGIDEAAFMKATHATFKLGIDFRDFGRIGDSYIHPFGSFGEELHGVGFHHYWLELHRHGLAGPLGDYSLAVQAALANRFRPPVQDDSLGSTYGYAYQFDATLFGPFMREFGLTIGVERQEGRVVSVERDAESGNVTALMLADGRRIEGDLFVDCSGFRSILLGQELGVAWEDWTHWLPCDRAAAMPCTHASEDIRPYTTATAMLAGWRWQIPLQHRMGNGYVFSSAHISEEQACDAIRAAAEGTPLAEPRLLKFRPGRRAQSWSHNVIGVGLASGFLEPLESTSIHLIQSHVSRLIQLFPRNRNADAERAEYNRRCTAEFEQIRDFLILHYHQTAREDSEFWRYCKNMAVPDSLTQKLALFAASGRVGRDADDLFRDASWVQVMLGQGIMPADYDPMADQIAPQQLAEFLANLCRLITRAVASLPRHEDYLHQHCAADLATLAA